MRANMRTGTAAGVVLQWYRPGRGTLRNPKNRIGELRESSLHAQLKALYLPRDGRSEVPVGGSIADVLGPDGRITEIQTAGFSRLKGKLSALLDAHRVRLVHPIAVEKELVVYDAAQRSLLYRRRSPKRGSVLHLVDELVGIAGLLRHPNLELEVLLTREEEVRRRDGGGSWRRGGATIADRRVIEIVGRRLFREPGDYRSLLPPFCPPRFTHRELAALGVPLRRAQKLTYCLRAAGVLRIAARVKRAYLFEPVEGR